MFFGHPGKLLKSIILSYVLSCPLLFAKNSNELIYTEPFDLAAGGTTLTRASQEGIVFANPALLPLGGAWIRWVGFQAGLLLDRDLAVRAKNGLGNAVGAEDDNFIDQLFSNSLHFGQTATLSFLNKNFAVSVFDRVELDLAGKRFGDAGLPSVNFGVEAYGGVLVSYASRPWRWLSIGVTGKRLVASEPEIVVPIADQEKIRQLTENTDSLRDEVDYAQGSGLDLGALLLWQGNITII